MISGKVCKKLVESDMPYQLQLRIIHDTENDKKNLEAFILDYYKTKKTVERIRRYDLRDKIRCFFFPPTEYSNGDA